MKNSVFSSLSRWIACPEELSAPIVRKKFLLSGVTAGEIRNDILPTGDLKVKVTR